MGCAFTWTHSENSEAKRVVLLIHGLNNPASVMDELAEHFSQMDHTAVLSLGLSGHVNQRWGEVNAELWKRDVVAAIEEIKFRYPNTEIFGVGFSLGASLLLTEKALSESLIRKRILIAPAIFLRSKAKFFLGLFSFLRYFRLSFPSRNEKRYRAHSKTSFQAYHALRLVMKEVRKNSDNLKPIPATVFISMKDELLNAKKTKRWANDVEFGFQAVSSKQKRNSEHFFLNDEVLGSEAWDKFIRQLTTELN